MGEGSYTYTVKWMHTSENGTAGNARLSDTGALTINLTVSAPSDTTPPVITINVPADGAAYFLNQEVIADWTVTDDDSGVNWDATYGTVANGEPIYTTTVGQHEFYVYAEDNAGNVAEMTVTYNVLYDFNGLLSPYQAPPRAYKINSSIPLKWQYTDYYGTPVDSALANPSIAIKLFIEDQLPSDGTPIVVDDPGNSGWQYDPDMMMWQWNWQTKGQTAGIYNIWITSAQTGQIDGPFEIQLKK
jgi:hypothetical protein